VVVEAGRRIFLLQAVNVSGRGAKVRPTERLGEGHVVRLAFFFTDDHQRRLAHLLAEVAVASPALWTSALN
jgi:hypothetical protein